MGSLHSRHVRGNLAFWHTHEKRLCDAIGPDVRKYELRADHLGAAATDPTGWTSTVVEAGAGNTEFDPADLDNYIGRITTDAAENDGGSYQLLGEVFSPTSTRDIYVGGRFALNDVLQSDILFGLCITDTALLGGMTDGVYFEKLDGSAAVSFVSEKDSTETQTDNLATLVNATDVILEMYWDGTSWEALINGVSVYGPSVPANNPNDEMLRLSLEFLTGEAVAKTCDVGWLRAIQIGR